LTLASALLHQILSQSDISVWTELKEIYLPSEYKSLWKIINSHVDRYGKLPTFEDLKFEIRDSNLQEMVFAIESVETEVDANTLLDYQKNEFTQNEILTQIDSYVDETVAFSTAEENLEGLQEIVVEVSEKVDTTPPNENMSKIELFDPEEELDKFVPLGLNQEYDIDFAFSPKDLVLVGGRRGAGKSITCANLANNVYERGRSALYFTIEMDSRQILQRVCALGANVPVNRLKRKNLSQDEWNRVAKWWCDRYQDSEDLLTDFYSHRNFDSMHSKLIRNPLREDRQIEIVYDPMLTIGKIDAVLKTKMNQLPDVGIIIVDYLNQVKRSLAQGRQYEWTEQIEVSKTLKAMAQEYETMVFSPYQTDATGEARFAKGILDAADAAYSLNAWSQEDNCMTFSCQKMRSNQMKDFTSEMDWETLRIGPRSVLNPEERTEMKESMATGENINEL
jgi:replicative DNA helicase|tara:strand:- start:417 stop:1766 length:1350 start_codon:yes stop_codon:yes gene_type:complete